MRFELHQSDSLEYMRRMPVDAFDCTITDPPYTEHVQSNMRSGHLAAPEKTIENAPTRAMICSVTPCTFDALQSYDWLTEVFRVTKGWVLCFCAVEQLGEYQTSMGERWIRSGIYRKQRATPQFSGDRPGNACEGIAIGHAGKIPKRWNGHGSHAFWEAMPVARTVHPTEKPLSLMLTLVDLFSFPGEHVFDPYAGTGTTLVAAIRRGRVSTGCEFNSEHPEYYQHAKRRCVAECNSTTMAAVQAGQLAMFNAIDPSTGNRFPVETNKEQQR